VVAIDRFGVSAPGDQALEALGITPEAVAGAARACLGR
jgi:transketolase